MNREFFIRCLVQAVRDAELAQVEHLRSEELLGTIHLTIPRDTVFLEIFATDEASAEATAMTLPISKWWTLDIHPTTLPPGDRKN